ncbi:UNVERIFIED_CONTAM: hypothetical protein Slati_0098700 [Sesamum latifolium]|uniref:Uncharacterized protein n=1 Tax=Sesamum latifolium TaxID=2727402 RepID=A0AAW2Y8X5_9LAMI
MAPLPQVQSSFKPGTFSGEGDLVAVLISFSKGFDTVGQSISGSGGRGRGRRGASRTMSVEVASTGLNGRKRKRDRGGREVTAKRLLMADGMEVLQAAVVADQPRREPWQS